MEISDEFIVFIVCFGGLFILSALIAKLVFGGSFQLTSAPTEPRITDTPSWFLPCGVIAIILAILGFLASAAVGGGGNFFGAILAGCVNPLFFVGLPLGVYWLRRYARNTARTGVDRSTTNLMSCPDCAHLVSRRAESCPSCGCPISPPKESS